ncbi:ependymin-2-like [Pygocentrus nattereri]|uniref:ependymin-2-like n=1 Tax=Pygocentrus nattereri TaxID=42514 RepID=UPI0008143501|nr:ependymin-2-like [Pygocentrus nattereri]
MELLVLLSICYCLALKACAQPTPCTEVSPPWITGGISTSTKDGAKTSSGIFTYDGWGQQVHFRNFEAEHNTTHFTDLLMNFKQKVVYEINHTSQTCKMKTLETSFHPMQVPPNSLFFGQAIMGTTSVPASGVLVNNWVGEISEIQANYVLVFSAYMCLPITALIHRPDQGWIAISFFYQVLTVVDPSKFIPPAFCQNVASEETDSTDFIRAIQSVI